MSDFESCERFVVSGRVQGVSFRMFTQSAARRHGVVGWVRNRSDGCVEGLVSGTAAALESFYAELRRGPRFAVVRSLERSPVAAEAPDNFEIRW